MLLSPPCASRGSNQSPTAELGIESTGEDSYSRVVETSSDTNQSRLGGRRIDNAKQGHQQSIRSKAPNCPLCKSTMIFKAARKGGFFYGCSQWPNCRGHRNPHGKNPGPKDLVEMKTAPKCCVVKKKLLPKCDS